MLENPQTGTACYIVVDVWEVLVPAPVTIIQESGGEYVARWQLGEGFEDYAGLKPENLFASEREAVEAIKEQRRISGCR